MIIAFIGLLGQGKTLGAVTFAKELHDTEGLKVVANITVKFAEKTNPIELIDFEINNCVLILDEAYTLLDSRYNSQASRYLGYFFKQTRKKSVHVFYTTQGFGDVDKRLRNITDMVVVCVKEPEVGFHFLKLDRVTMISLGEVFLPWENALKMFPEYDTYEVVMPMTINDPVTTLTHLKELIKATSNMKTFKTLVRAENPYLPVETIESLYTLLRAERDDLAEKLLRRGSGARPTGEPPAF